MKHSESEHFNCFGSAVCQALFGQACSVVRVGVAYSFHGGGSAFASLYLSGEITPKVRSGFAEMLSIC